MDDLSRFCGLSGPRLVLPPAVTYATVHTERANSRTVRVTTRVVFGTLLALAASAVSTCFVERHHGTDRNRCRRKVRKSYGLSTDWEPHRAATKFSHFSDNVCGPVRRTLRARGAGGRWPARTPAMAAD